MYYVLCNKYNELQMRLVEKGAVEVDPVLCKIEKTGKRIFGIWSKLILKKGPYNSISRVGRLKAFKYYLFAVIFLVSPLVGGIHRLIFFLNPRAAKRIVMKNQGV